MPLLGKKAKETPVYALLGGKFRDKLLIYHDAGSPNIVDPKPWVETQGDLAARHFHCL